VAFQVEIAKRHPKLDVIGRKRKPALEQFDPLVEVPGVGELAAELDEGRWKGWAPADCALQLFDGLVVAAGGAKRHGKQGFELRVVVAPGRSLQNIDGLERAVLRQQHAPEQTRGSDIAAVRLQDLRSKALRLVDALHLQRESGLLEDAIARA